MTKNELISVLEFLGNQENKELSNLIKNWQKQLFALI